MFVWFLTQNSLSPHLGALDAAIQMTTECKDFFCMTWDRISMLLSSPWGSPLTSLLIWRKLWQEKDAICLGSVFVPIKWILYQANAAVGIIKFIAVFFLYLNHPVGQDSLSVIYSDLAFFCQTQKYIFYRHTTTFVWSTSTLPPLIHVPKPDQVPAQEIPRGLEASKGDGSQ